MINGQITYPMSKKSLKKRDFPLTNDHRICYNTTVKQLRKRLLKHVQFDCSFRFDSHNDYSFIAENSSSCLKKSLIKSENKLDNDYWNML